MAERTGLEPAASRVTGGRYNQLNYRSTEKICRKNVSSVLTAKPAYLRSAP